MNFLLLDPLSLAVKFWVRASISSLKIQNNLILD